MDMMLFYEDRYCARRGPESISSPSQPIGQRALSSSIRRQRYLVMNRKITPVVPDSIVQLQRQSGTVLQHAVTTDEIAGIALASSGPGPKVRRIFRGTLPGAWGNRGLACGVL